MEFQGIRTKIVNGSSIINRARLRDDRYKVGKRLFINITFKQKYIQGEIERERKRVQAN